MGDLEVGGLPPAPFGSFDLAAFGELYSRHERSIARFLMRRTGSAELAADLTAEVFAAALLAWRRQARPADERAWLFGIAQHKLIDSYRHGRVEDDARVRLGMRRTLVTDESLRQIEALTAETPALELVEKLPAEQRLAITARVIDERDYRDIASELQLSEQVVRKRVSRGLRRLRQTIGGGQ